MTLYVGIDPGLDGAVVALDGASRVVARFVLPTVSAGTGGKRTLDTRGFVNALTLVGNTYEMLVALEELGSRPAERMGASSAISIGRNHGRLEGALVTLNVRYDLVRPQRWQKALGLGSDGDPKARAVAACRRMLPDLDLLATSRCRVPHDGIADAGMLALFALRVLANVQAGRPIGVA